MINSNNVLVFIPIFCIFIFSCNDHLSPFNEGISSDQRYRDLDNHGQVLNNAYEHTSFSGPHLNIEPTKGIGYVTGLASTTTYTEAGGYLMLAVFPCLQPYRLEYYTIAKTGDLDLDGEPFLGKPYDVSSMSFYDEDNRFIIRSFFVDYNGYRLYYRDFDTDSKRFLSAAVKVQYYTNNGLEIVTDKAMTEWVEKKGGSWYGPQKTIFTNHIINDRTLWGDGNFIYSVLTTAGPGNPIVVKSDDNFATMHLLAILPESKATCETAIGKLDDTVYILYRKDSHISFQTTKDFINYSAEIEIDNSAPQRPEILVYAGNAYLFVPMKDNDKSIMGGRSSYHLLKGKGSILSNFSTELILHNNYGLVYASAQFFNGRLLIAYSTNRLMLDGNKDGKSTMIFDVVDDYFQPSK